MVKKLLFIIFFIYILFFIVFIQQDPNEDTEWNDILRAKGIIPEKKKDAEITEDQIVQMMENTIDEKTGKGKLMYVF